MEPTEGADMAQLDLFAQTDETADATPALRCTAWADTPAHFCGAAATTRVETASGSWAVCQPCADRLGADTPAAPAPAVAEGTYRARRLARAERLAGWADKREAKADAGLAKADAMASVIPFGQPILAGHYSEGRDRRYRDRIHGTMVRAVEDGRKAEEMRGRAASIVAQADAAIYSDDPDACDRLRARIAELEAERERVKAFNASCRKGSPAWEILTDAEARGLRRTAEVAAYQVTDRGGRFKGFPAYHLANLGGNITRQRQRLAQLERAATVRAAEVVEELEGGDGVTLRRTAARVELYFPGKPSEEIRSGLKAHGFRWDRFAGCWHGRDAAYAATFVN